MCKSIVVDANVILRYLLKDNEIFFKEALFLFDQALKGDIEIIIEQIILCEVIYVLEKVYRVSKGDISNIVKGLILQEGIKLDNKDNILKALDIYSNKNIDFADSILCAMAECYQVKTFDKKLNNCIMSRHDS